MQGCLVETKSRTLVGVGGEEGDVLLRVGEAAGGEGEGEAGWVGGGSRVEVAFPTLHHPHPGPLATAA